MTIWFDVEDLVHYFRVGNKRVSGIQRVSFEIFQAAMSLVDKDFAIGFVRHGTKPLTLIPVAWEDLLADFGDADPPPLPPSEPTPDAPASPPPSRKRKPSLSRRLARTTVDRLPTDIRRPLVLAGVMQLQVAAALARFGVQTTLYPLRRGTMISRAALARTRRKPPSAALNQPAPGVFDRLAQPGDTLLVLGAPWNRERYSDLARHLRDERRMYFGVLVHDLVPIRHPEWCHRGVPRMFREWYTDVLPFCDIVFANSRHTAADVEAYARETGLALNGRVRTLPIGSGFGGSGFGSAAEPPTPAPSGNYVLFVSTMEARKNHALLVRVWSMLLDEVDAGLRTAASVPDLVFAGRIGWLVADLLAQLDHTGWLGRRIRLVANPSDAELRALYAGCLFTVFPSWHEGWGLPVTESLALGKPCIASNAASLPEAGGALCRYFDPGSVRSARTAIAAALDDPADLAAWSAQIRREWHPTPWTETARALFTHIAALDGPA